MSDAADIPRTSEVLIIIINPAEACVAFLARLILSDASGTHVTRCLFVFFLWQRC